MQNKRRGWAMLALAVFWLLFAATGFIDSPPARWPAFLAWLPISPLLGTGVLIIAAVIAGLYLGPGPLLNRRDRQPSQRLIIGSLAIYRRVNGVWHLDDA